MCILVVFSKNYPVLVGQFRKRAKKHVDGIFSIFKPTPKTHEKAGDGQCEQQLSIFSAFKCSKKVLLSILLLIFHFLVKKSDFSLIFLVFACFSQFFH